MIHTSSKFGTRLLSDLKPGVSKGIYVDGVKFTRRNVENLEILAAGAVVAGATAVFIGPAIAPLFAAKFIGHWYITAATGAKAASAAAGLVSGINTARSKQDAEGAWGGIRNHGILQGRHFRDLLIPGPRQNIARQAILN